MNYFSAKTVPNPTLRVVKRFQAKGWTLRYKSEDLLLRICTAESKLGVTPDEVSSANMHKFSVIGATQTIKQ